MYILPPKGRAAQVFVENFTKKTNNNLSGNFFVFNASYKYKAQTM